MSSKALYLNRPVLVIDASAFAGGFSVGREVEIRWTARGPVGPIRIEFQKQGESEWREIDVQPSHAGRISWNVPEELGDGACRVRVLSVMDPTFHAISPLVRVTAEPLTLATAADLAILEIRADPLELGTLTSMSRLTMIIANKGRRPSTPFCLRVRINDREAPELGSLLLPIEGNGRREVAVDIPASLLDPGTNRIQWEADPYDLAFHGGLSVANRAPSRRDFDPANNARAVALMRAQTEETGVEDLRADPALIGLEIEPADPREGDFARIRGRGRNRGNRRVGNVHVRFTVDGRPIEELEAASEGWRLEGGAGRTAEVKHRFDAPGFRTIRAWIETPDSRDDADSSNNAIELKIQVKPNTDQRIRELLEEMLEAYRSNDANGFLAVYAPGFKESARVDFTAYKERVASVMNAWGAPAIEAELVVERIEPKGTNSVEATYLLSERIAWSDGWGEPLVRLRRIKDTFQFENSRWRLVKRE